MAAWKIRRQIYAMCCVVNSELALVGRLGLVMTVVIAATEVYRKKNKFQWAKHFMTILSSRDILFFESEK